MVNRITYALIMTLLVGLSIPGWTQSQTPADLMIAAERNPAPAKTARQAAIQQQIPIHIYLPERQIMMEVYGLENGEPLYAVITDFAHPLTSGFSATWPEIEQEFDLSGARINYGNGQIVNPRAGLPATKPHRVAGDTLLLIIDSSSDRVMTFDLASGDVVELDFIPNSPELQTPIQAQLTPWGTITVSDQLTDIVQEFDTSGVFLGGFAPAGGVNNDILDNARGHRYLADSTMLVSVASGANQDAIAHFDAGGNYLGNFIENNAGGLDSPWDIYFRDNDVLVSGSISDAVHSYDLTGQSLGIFASPIEFPRQIIELANGDVAIANFSGGTASGIEIYDASGNFLNRLNPVTGNRGLWLLGNGNFITTNGAGVHEVDPVTNTLVRTIVGGFACMHISLYAPESDTSGGDLLPPTNLSATGGENLVDLAWEAPSEGTELAYDDGTSEGTISIGETAEGDLAVRFTPNVYPSTLLAIKVNLQSSTDPTDPVMGMGNWTIWDGTSAGPGTVLASGSHPAVRDMFDIVDVSAENITISADDFFISYNETLDSVLSLAWDTGSPSADRSWVNAPGLGITWVTSGSIGPQFDNNYMIRALVLEGSGPNARVVELAADGTRRPAPMEDVKALFRSFVAQGMDLNVSADVRFDGTQNAPLRAVSGTPQPDPEGLGGEYAIDALTGYNIFRSEDNLSFSMIANVDSATLNYTDSGLTGGTTYYYYVTAVYDEGESEPSDTVSATPTSGSEEIVDHVTASYLGSVSNEGTIGYLNAFPPSTGNGFQFNPVSAAGQRLFEGAIMVATDSFHVSDGARDENQVFDMDFQFLAGMTDVSSGTSTIFETAFNDALAESPIGVSIDQTTISVDETGQDKFLTFQLDITNNSGALLSDVNVGGFFDWDVDPATAADRGSVVVDSTNTINSETFIMEVVELHQGTGANSWVGVVSLSESEFYARRVAISNDEIYPPRMTDGDKWTYMNFNRATNPNGDGGTPQDHGQFFGLYPFDLAAGATQRVGFAIVAGTSLADIVASARAAQADWVARGNDLTVITTVSIDDVAGQIPLEYSLNQNYPNPFNPTTTVKYGLKADADVSLKIYNVLGQLVRTLVNEHQTAGYQQVVWDGTNDLGKKVASGIYVYRIEANDFSASRKLILMK